MVSGNKVVSMMITLTDNAFGDDNVAVGSILDPGMPTYEVTTSTDSSQNTDNSFHPNYWLLAPTNRLGAADGNTRWNLATVIGNEEHRPMMFVDPEENETSALVERALFYGDGFDGSDAIGAAHYSDRVSTNHFGRHETDRQFMDGWKLRPVESSTEYVGVGILDTQSVIRVAPASSEAMPQWLRVDEAGRVYVSSKAQQDEVFVLQVGVVDADGNEQTLYKEVSSKGVVDITNLKNLDVTTGLELKSLPGHSKTEMESSRFTEMYLHQISKLTTDKKYKSKFNQQIHQAKDELYSLNVLS